MRLVVSLLVLVLAGCGQQQATYPPQIEVNFRNACEAQSPPAGLCACVWDRVEAEVPVEDFMAIERLPINERAKHPLTEQINGYTFACHAQLQGASGGEPAPTP